MIEFLKIRAATLNKVLDYLTKRPWKDVNDLISEVHREIEPFEEEIKKEEESRSLSQMQRFECFN